MYIYICIDIYMYIYMYIYIRTCRCIHASTHWRLRRSNAQPLSWIAREMRNRRSFWADTGDFFGELIEISGPKRVPKSARKHRETIGKW